MTRVTASPSPRTIARRFDLGGVISDIHPYGAGLINDTYLVTVAGSGTARVILQRVNRRVFTHPGRLMGNLRILLDHVRQNQDGEGGVSGLRFPVLYPSRDGLDHVIDESGELWRAMSFIEHSRTLGRLEDPRQAMEVGLTLGRFHALVRDLDTRRLHDSRPGFHDTPRYVRRLLDLMNAPASGTVTADLRFCHEFVAARAPMAGVLEEARRTGRLPLQIVHGDPKLDNFLFDERHRHAVSLIDLDTVKPGLVQHDIADCLRSCCNTSGESPDTDQPITFDTGLAHALLRGYFDAAGKPAGSTRRTPALLYEAIRLIPFELGVRFLIDHLEGDKYFRIASPGQNLRRALTQFRLTRSIEEQEEEIRDMIAAVSGGT